MRRPRILFVARPGSIHAARWTTQLEDLGWDVRLFASMPTAIHGDFQNVTAYGVSRYRPPGLHSGTRLRGFWPFRRGAWHVGNPLRPLFAPALTALIRRVRPDLVHSLEIQNAGYLTLAARERLGWFPPWIVSNWGSDIYFFGRLPEHQPKIRAVLEACDYFIPECARDIELSRDFGFRGEVFGVYPVGGGFDLGDGNGLRQPGPSSARRMIVLKGQEGQFGRALVGLRAFELCAGELRGYRITIPLATPDVKHAAGLLTRRTGLQLDTETSLLPRARMLALHGSSRMSIGLSISDGASNSMLEAMMMGSLPIQSCTACADEWIADGESGLVVPPEDPNAVAEAIRRALSDDELVDRAAARNAQVARERLDERVIRPEVIGRYREILGL